MSKLELAQLIEPHPHLGWPLHPAQLLQDLLSETEVALAYWILSKGTVYLLFSEIWSYNLSDVLQIASLKKFMPCRVAIFKHCKHFSKSWSINTEKLAGMHHPYPTLHGDHVVLQRVGRYDCMRMHTHMRDIKHSENSPPSNTLCICACSSARFHVKFSRNPWQLNTT